MRPTTMLCTTLALALAAAPPQAAAAQGTLPPAATAPIPNTRLVVSFEVSAALVSNRLPGDWAKAMPEPLLDELAADDNFAGIDLGASDGSTTGAVGNGILVRFDFADMSAYREWEARPETAMLLAELKRFIGYQYARTALSMRRVPLDAHHAMPTSPRRVPAPAAPGAQSTSQASTQRS